VSCGRCFNVKASVTWGEGDLARAARRAARTDLPHHAQAVLQAKAVLEQRRTYAAEHFAICTHP
jgi:hypothetical protein